MLDVHQFPGLNTGSEASEVDHPVQGDGLVRKFTVVLTGKEEACWRREVAVDIAQPVLQVFLLPFPPNPVEIGVMQKEQWVYRADPYIST